MSSVEEFRIDLNQFFDSLKKIPGQDNGYRQRLVIPKALYKGLAWGMAWSANRVLGPDDPDTKRAWKKVEALFRLHDIQKKRGLVEYE